MKTMALNVLITNGFYYIVINKNVYQKNLILFRLTFK